MDERALRQRLLTDALAGVALVFLIVQQSRRHRLGSPAAPLIVPWTIPVELGVL
jgi:hypothetical protein